MTEPIKILFLAANPHDISPLRLDEESRAIDLALRQAQFRSEFELEQHWAVRASDLQGLLLRHQPDIVHFSGHGSPSAEIVLQDEEGNSQPVSASALKGLFTLFKEHTRCVVLNACYSEQQARAIAEEIGCVIGMSDAIDDESAIQFAASFYQGLGYGKDIKTAFELGCLQINLENLGEQDTPQLLADRTDPAQIFLVPHAEEHRHHASHDPDNVPTPTAPKRQAPFLQTAVITATAIVVATLLFYLLSTRGNNQPAAGGVAPQQVEADSTRPEVASQVRTVLEEATSTATTTAAPTATATPSPIPTPAFTAEESGRMLLAAVADKDLEQTLRFICTAQHIKLTTAPSWLIAFADLTLIGGFYGSIMGSLSDENYQWDISALGVDAVFQDDQQAELRVYGSMEGQAVRGHMTTYIDTVHWQMVKEEGSWRFCPLPIEQFGKIIFVSRQDNKSDLYSMNADGSDQTFLMANPDRYHAPVWSPDGRKIAFAAGEHRLSAKDIYVMNADGSNRIRLTNNETSNEYPVWSPDSQKIAFISGAANLDFDLYIVNADGNGLTRLVDSPSPLKPPTEEAQGAPPISLYFALTTGRSGYSWAANSQQIAFTARLDKDELQIYVISIDGSNLRPLTEMSRDNLYPAWSPDGQKIAFFHLSERKSQLYVMNADGSDLNLLSKDPDAEPIIQQLIWSPDSQKIVFWATYQEELDPFLYVVHADGSGQLVLSGDSDFTQGKYLVWSPNSQQIAFTSGRSFETNRDVDVIYPDRTGRKQLTNNPGLDYPIAWLPP
jgi:Tol biopolymer transport system component